MPYKWRPFRHYDHDSLKMMKKVLGLALVAACAEAFSLAPATSFVGRCSSCNLRYPGVAPLRPHAMDDVLKHILSQKNSKNVAVATQGSRVSLRAPATATRMQTAAAAITRPQRVVPPAPGIRLGAACGASCDFGTASLLLIRSCD